VSPQWLVNRRFHHNILWLNNSNNIFYLLLFQVIIWLRVNHELIDISNNTIFIRIAIDNIEKDNTYIFQHS